LEERRDSFRRHAERALIAAAAGGAFAGAAHACELPAGTRLESPRFSLSYRTIPAQITVGEQFVLELAACPKAGASLPARLKLDAQMPEHRHGMNYQPSLKATGTGRYRSEGWLFHMPGRWEFSFELGGERLTHSVRIE
jgi:hypothetical protein